VRNELDPRKSCAQDEGPQIGSELRVHQHPRFDNLRSHGSSTAGPSGFTKPADSDRNGEGERPVIGQNAATFLKTFQGVDDVFKCVRVHDEIE
jgi:hypothetical protein